MRILLTNEQVLVCSALRRWLEQESDFEVVGEATEVTNLVPRVQETKPHSHWSKLLSMRCCTKVYPLLCATPVFVRVSKSLGISGQYHPSMI